MIQEIVVPGTPLETNIPQKSGKVELSTTGDVIITTDNGSEFALSPKSPIIVDLAQVRLTTMTVTNNSADGALFTVRKPKKCGCGG